MAKQCQTDSTSLDSLRSHVTVLATLFLLAARNIMPDSHSRGPMKLLPSCLLLLLVGFAASNLYAQYPDLEKRELKKNKIKGIFEYRQSPCDFDLVKSDAAQWNAAMWTDSRNWYDSSGNLTGEYEFNKYSAAPVIKSYKYDDQDSLVEPGGRLH